MKAIKLTDLLPQQADLEINGKTYHLRPVNVNDWAWMENRWGANVSGKLKGLTIPELTTIVFRLLVDKTDFLPCEVEDYDDDGNKVKVSLTGPQRLAMSLVGVGALAKAATALNEAMGLKDLSEEDVRSLEEAAQKKIQALESQAQRQEQPPQTGTPSLTKSPQSTDTHQGSSVS